MVVGSKKSKKEYFFFAFLNWVNQTWYWEKRWLFLIGNWAEIRPLEIGRKGPSFIIPDSYLTNPLNLQSQETGS